MLGSWVVTSQRRQKAVFPDKASLRSRHLPAGIQRGAPTELISQPLTPATCTRGLLGELRILWEREKGSVATKTWAGRIADLEKKVRTNLGKCRKPKKAQDSRNTGDKPAAHGAELMT